MVSASYQEDASVSVFCGGPVLQPSLPESVVCAYSLFIYLFVAGVTSPVVANAPINAILFAVEHRAVHFFTHWSGSAGWSDTQKQFAAGALSGLTQTPLSCSAERVKILLQVEHKSHRPAYSGPLSATQYLLARGGLRSLYSGMALTVARDVPAFGVYFSTYHGLKRRLKSWKAQRAASPSRASSGADTVAAAAAAVASWTASDSASNAAVPTSAAADPSSAATAEDSKLRRRRKQALQAAAASTQPAAAPPPAEVELGPIELMLAGGLAGTASWAFLHPIDVLKSKLQAHKPKKGEWFPKGGLAGIIRRSYRAEGPTFLLRGLVPTCARAFPASAITFLVYEWVVQAGSARLALPSGANSHVHTAATEPAEEAWAVVRE